MTTSSGVNSTLDFMSTVDFTGNYGGYSGTLSLSGTRATFYDVTTFTANRAGSLGGGLFYNQGAVVTFLKLVRFVSNTAGSYGGGVYGDSATLTFSDSVILTGNKANNDGGGVLVQNGGSLSFKQALDIVGNQVSISISTCRSIAHASCGQ